MSLLSAPLIQLRGELLAAAEKIVPEVGFTNEALLRALDKTEKRGEVTDAILAQMFERGFTSALVDHIVRRSNAGTHQLLEQKYNKNAIIDLVAKKEENFTLGRLALPTSQNVAEDAMLAKIAFLQPFASHWANAVAIEYRPSNFPYTMLGLTEFVDTTSFYMERVDNLGKLLEPARSVLNAKMMASYVPAQKEGPGDSAVADERQSPTKEFLHSFVRGVPLTGGPYATSSSFSPEWFIRRAKVATMYGATITSLLGDQSRDAIETRNLTKTLASTLF